MEIGLRGRIGGSPGNKWESQVKHGFLHVPVESFPRAGTLLLHLIDKFRKLLNLVIISLIFFFLSGGVKHTFKLAEQ